MQTVTLEKPEDGRSWRVIFVDWWPWGFVQQSYRGMHGVQYFFQDSTREVVPEKHGKDVRYSGLFERMSGHANVWSDKFYLRSMGFYGSSAQYRAKQEGKYIPLEARLIEAITKAIKEKRLLSPADLKARAVQERLQREEKIAEAGKRLNDLFDARAAKAVESLPEKYRAQMIAPIVEAMKWAQSQ